MPLFLRGRIVNIGRHDSGVRIYPSGKTALYSWWYVEMNNSTRWCCRTIVGTVGVILSISAVSIASEPPPNIILCMGDDHGWDETGYNGHPHLKTPVLDEMAASGLRLDRFYSAHPSCSPTRGSVMTGRHPNRYGTFAPNYSIRPEEISIARILQKAGYACGHFGKWHLGPVKVSSPTSPGAMGFHQWLSHDNFFELNPTFSRNGASPIQFEGESSEIVIRETIRFLETATQNAKPFFAVVWFGSPHEPYSGLKEDLALYADLPDSYSTKQVKLTSNKTGRQTRRPLKDVLQERYAEITAMDRSIGQLRKWLGDNGQQENTLLWYCGDNGTPGDGIVTSPFRGQKGTMYEGGIRVPGIIEWPGQISQPRHSAVNTVTNPSRQMATEPMIFTVGSHREVRSNLAMGWGMPSRIATCARLSPHFHRCPVKAI